MYGRVITTDGQVIRSALQRFSLLGAFSRKFLQSATDHLVTSGLDLGVHAMNKAIILWISPADPDIVSTLLWYHRCLALRIVHARFRFATAHRCILHFPFPICIGHGHPSRSHIGASWSVEAFVSHLIHAGAVSHLLQRYNSYRHPSCRCIMATLVLFCSESLADLQIWIALLTALHLHLIVLKLYHLLFLPDTYKTENCWNYVTSLNMQFKVLQGDEMHFLMFDALPHV